MNGRNKFSKIKNILFFLSRMSKIMPYSIRIKIFNGLRHLNGNIGIAMRYVLLKSLTNTCGDNVSVHPGVYMYNFKNIDIGNNVSIHPMCYIEGAGGVCIGNDVSIAHSVTMISSTHTYKEKETPIKYQDCIYEKINIQSNVWIGAKATILYGVQIDSGCIIAAHALVNKNVMKNTIVAGIPAKIIKNR